MAAVRCASVATRITVPRQWHIAPKTMVFRVRYADTQCGKSFSGGLSSEDAAPSISERVIYQKRQIVLSDWLGAIASCGVKGCCECQPAAYALTANGLPA